VGYGLKNTNLNGIQISMRAQDPKCDDVVRVLRILSDESGGPYLVHCQGGADRTGLVIAAYRMVVQNWSYGEAIGEMRYCLGFNKNVMQFLQNLDVEKIKLELGKS
jgi:protein tyrosine/serine phosphatase